ncbi:phosphoribosyl-ATP pyrophosphohydrolase [Candidatus Kaiserbacteria bacterium]|nr:phosphoribosyl-ATP pyrophosphohydrolase [Candidatus Kaiserbacteria bacterium]
MTQLQEMTEKAKQIMVMYQEDYPEVKMDRDYAPFKMTEEWGEALQVYLMLTDRGRQKGKSKTEIRAMLQEEIADVLGYLLVFAAQEQIDLEAAIEQKWFVHLKRLEK